MDIKHECLGNQRVPQKQAAIPRDNPYSGTALFYFFDDDLEVRADFIPPARVGSPVRMEQIQTFFSQYSIVYGIQEENIQTALAECALTLEPVKDVLIAKGDPPVTEIKDYFELNPRLVSAPLPGKSPKRIDYRSYSPFIIVKKDQALAQKRPGIPGQAGKNVHGDFVPYKTVLPEGVIGGNNTRTNDKFIIAEINGQFIQNKQILQVEKCLVIKGGVGYATGHISFPGDVIIEGPVSDGFKIYAEGSVTIKETLDVTEVMAKGDLTVAGGIIGRGKGIAKIRGPIKTKFIENCRVACGQSVSVERAIINSTVYAMDKVDLGNKGFIIGGNITAIHGVRAGKIGKASGMPTKLHCGIDFTVQQEQEKAKAQIQLLEAKIDKIQYFMALPETSHEKWLKLEENLKRIQEERYNLRERASDLQVRTNADENAVIEVYGEIASGTLIEICQIGLFVAEPLRKVRIKLDRFYQKLISEPLI
ncbi:MAG: FapA family protein [Treponema sp.]|jgi:uncharacterized protein (DUF342 family)|nr:FapA family protein [Treponema sp.]